MRSLGLVSLLALLAAPVALALELQPGDILALGQHSTAQNLVMVDPTTGDRTVISGCTDATCTGMVGSGPLWGSSFQDMSIEADGTVLVLGSRCLIRVDPSNGDRTLISSGGSSPCPVTGAGPDFGQSVEEVPPSAMAASAIGAIGDWGTLAMAGMLAC